MEKTRALINHLNLSEEERSAFEGGEQGWIEAVQGLLVEAYGEFSEMPDKEERLTMAVENSLGPEMAAALHEYFEGLLQEQEATIEAQAQALKERLQAMAETGSLIEDPDEEGAHIHKAAEVFGSPDQILKKLQEDPETNTYLALMALRGNENALDGYRQDTSTTLSEDEERRAEEEQDYSKTEVGGEVMTYLQEMMQNINLVKNDEARALNEYSGQPQRSAATVGMESFDYSGIRNFKEGPEILIAGATPAEFEAAMVEILTEDIMAGRFPFEFKFTAEADSDVERKAEANDFAERFVEKLKAEEFFTRDGYFTHNEDTGRQVAHFYPKEASFAQATNIFIREAGPKLPDLQRELNFGPGFFEQVVVDQMRQRYAPDHMSDLLHARFEGMVREGKMSIYGREDSTASLEALQRVIENVEEQMYAGDLNGSYINERGWDEEQFARLMREGMDQAGIYFENGAGPAAVDNRLTVQVSADADILDFGATPIAAQINPETLQVNDPETGEALFAFKDVMHIYRYEATEEGAPALVPIEQSNNERPIGDVTPLELRELLGEAGTFEITPVYGPSSEEGVRGEIETYKVSTGSKNAFYITPDAIEDGTMSPAFSEKLNAVEDEVADPANTQPQMVQDHSIMPA